MLVNIPTLEKANMVVLFEHKGLVKEIKNAKFISENLEIIEKWASRLESLLYTICQL